MNLRDLEIESTYSTDDDADILNDFYNPVLGSAIKYDRITGYFSPKVFAIAARGFRRCICNGCKIRIISSVVVEEETYDAINKNTALNDVSDCINTYNPDSLSDDLEYNYLQLFTYLYSTGRLEMKIAAIKDGAGILHEKIGIIEDAIGNAISFSGSNNETASGWINNIEEFKVFKNWEPIQIEYYKSDNEKFIKYWNNQSQRAKIMTLTEAENECLIRKSHYNDITLDEILKKINEKENHHKIKESISCKTNSIRELRGYQKEAINHWKDSGYVSIFEMATGTGKTLTAVNALDDFKQKNGSLHCVIGMPLITLLVQWSNELKDKFNNDLQIIVASSSIDSSWREKISSLAVKLKLGIPTNFAILVLYGTLANNSLICDIKKLEIDDLLFLADEMHNLVTDRCIDLLSMNLFKYRLGLSATPVRLWRPQESAIVTRFFGDNPYLFTLERAIKEGFLVPYNYFSIQVALTIDEFEEYCSLSKKIGQYYAMNDADNPTALSVLLKRARIKKNAENKKLALENKIVELKNKDIFHHALIYTDNVEFLEEIQKILSNNNILTSRFTGEESVDERQKIIDSLRKKNIDAIVAIKCLDEGVDIPSAKNAFFVSSNTDPREYIQRLGRVLRLDKDGDKSHADIYDFIVTPPNDTQYVDTAKKNIARNLVKNEVIRAQFFCGLAKNIAEARVCVERIVDDLNMTFTDDELNFDNRED